LQIEASINYNNIPGMIKLLILCTIAPLLVKSQTNNYLDYHNRIIKAEEYIVNRQFNESVAIYRGLSQEYDHMFLRDCKIAAQLSAYTGDTDNLFYFLEKGLKTGWTLKEMKKNKHFKKFKTDDQWEKLRDNEDEYKGEFFQSINLLLRTEVREMLTQDQKRALRVALTPVKKWREQYTDRKFVPNNRVQVRRINEIIEQTGYPGEKLIGDKSWATVIISHNEHDTIYKELRPKLYKAFERGELSAIDLAIIETWRIVVNTGRKEKGFVIWNEEINRSEAIKADSLRKTIGLRSIALNNKLIQIERELEMEFYLSPFHGGLITVKE
jgi:hypothetical protein